MPGFWLLPLLPMQFGKLRTDDQRLPGPHSNNPRFAERPRRSMYSRLRLGDVLPGCGSDVDEPGAYCEPHGRRRRRGRASGPLALAPCARAELRAGGHAKASGPSDVECITARPVSGAHATIPPALS
jgi:hypothetical protein